MEHIINPIYKKKDSIEKLQKAWNTKEIFPHILLTKIFPQVIYKQKEKEIKILFFKRESRPDRYSFAQAKASSLHIFDNKELHAFLSEVLQRKIKHILGEAYYFSWKDYKVVLKEQDKNAIDIIFDCTEDWKEEYGGSLIYKDEKGRYIKFMGLPNTMIIIERKNTEKYIQYVNNLSKGKKRYLLIGKIS
ncbi:MAG: hypothetical protein QT08_C0009G0069 [archaeon GW2011_AR17]|nr:MAG: hypothetical protein QT08_C0009G0069 [archaeon GW2011_AR17]HIH14734.1 hypothetical protein [Nanoarchaeota archaeon]HIH59025.1 hypothetical protein [Nanoarchaeota archaeon]HII14413.1 hypothetical protein [Nanoarchaeota archaeon]HIJ04964.1 hypothetical protein [Nanoarchaeota archaeon]